MSLTGAIRRRIKAARMRRARWADVVDVLRLLPFADGRSRLWTRVTHGGEVHQTSTDTAAERYPQLFDLAARQRPHAKRILSFGCSTGEELLSLRKRFPDAEIVGAEINSRTRRIARRITRHDQRIRIVPPSGIQGSFDLIFALAVLQREPHKIAEMEVADLTRFYPFTRFDETVSKLVSSLGHGGLLCVQHAHYRVEDGSAAGELQRLADAPLRSGHLFGSDGKRLRDASAGTMFVKA